MLYVEIKQLFGTKWRRIKVEDVLDKTLLDFMEESKEKLIAAVYRDKEAIMFISNDQKYVDLYKDDPLSLHSNELRLLMIGDKPEQLLLVAHCFPDSTIGRISTQ